MTSPDPDGVFIGFKEIYEKLVTVLFSVERIAGKQDEHGRDLADHKAATAAILTDHEMRLRTQERRRWPLPSLAVVGSIGALVVAVVALFTRT